MRDSDKLIRLGKTDAPSLSKREAEQARIAAQVAEYLARGREIERVETGISGEAINLRRTKKERQAEIRRRAWNQRQSKKGAVDEGSTKNNRG